jgi:peroxiredoxin
MKTMKLMAALVVAGGLAFAGAMTAPAIAEPGTKAAVPAHKHDTKEKKADAVKIGEAAPEFTLTDTDGKTHKLSEYKGKIVVLEWFNPECPFVVKHHAESKKNMTFNKLHEDYNSKGVVFLAINSSASGKQGHGLELNKKMKTEYKLPFPILIDESGETGRAYGAKTTPHCYVINAEGKLSYMGAIDNNKHVDKAGDKNYVKMALDEMLAGKAVTEATTAPYGCGVKYSN